MGSCCHLSRRQILKWGALVAATPFLAGAADLERAYGFRRRGASTPCLPINLELVTLTETSAILTWFTGDPTRVDSMGRLAPVPADTEVLLGTTDGNLQVVLSDPTPTAYHYAELTGLEPGRPYVYVARSNGIPAIPSPSYRGNPQGTSTAGDARGEAFAFVTPEPPPGQFLFAIALCNDLHFGETVAGLATTQAGLELPPGIRQVDGEPPYPEVMTAALTNETRDRGAHLLLAAGDITAEAASTDVNRAKSFLDGFGAYRSSYFVTRGNHDRPHTGADSASCTAVPGADGYHDCFADAFFSSTEPTWFAHDVFGLRLLGLDTYDKIGNGGDNGVMSETQFAFVRDTLLADPDQPTLAFGHHPVTLEASVTTTTRPILFDLDPQQSLQLEMLYAQAPGVFLHHSGHTHRNKRALSPVAPNVVFQEVAAVKEYPGGFHLLRVFTGGFSLNFYKFADPLAQEWSERSRPEYGGLAPFYTFGNPSDRNLVVTRDFSGLQPA
jgi:hypothetical protein